MTNLHETAQMRALDPSAAERLLTAEGATARDRDDDERATQLEDDIRAMTADELERFAAFYRR